jgi:hypothetical protein
MRSRYYWIFVLFSAALFGGVPSASAGSLTLSHSSSALAGASGPAITLLSITGDNNGTNYTFTLTFANPTIEGPSSGKSDAVYGFINIDADKNALTGVSGTFLASNFYESGFGRFSPSSQGIDAYINLSSERDALHGAPGLVDLVTTNGFNVVGTLPVKYTNAAGSTPSTLSLSIPLTDFSAKQINLLDTGSFSVIVGNSNNATDFLAPSSVPEPGSLILLAAGMSFAGLAVARTRWIARPGSRCRREVS